MLSNSVTAPARKYIERQPIASPCIPLMVRDSNIPVRPPAVTDPMTFVSGDNEIPFYKG